MAKIKIKLVGTLRNSLESSVIEVATERRVSFRELVQLAAEQTGKNLLPYIADPNNREILQWVMVLVNQENIRHLQGWDTLLDEEDEIWVMLADIAGG